MAQLCHVLFQQLAFVEGGHSSCFGRRSLLERLLGARLVYKQATMSRSINFEYLNRQLVWQEMSELLLFLLPLLNVSHLSQWMRNLYIQGIRLPVIGSKQVARAGMRVYFSAVMSWFIDLILTP